MVFPLLCFTLIGLAILLFGSREARHKNKQARTIITIGLIITVVSLGLFIFSLWVFASGM